MPLTAAAGPISLAQVALATSLAASEAFQDLLEAAGIDLGMDPVAEALLRIHHDEIAVASIPAGDEVTAAEFATVRPFALTNTARRGAFGLRRRATGTYSDRGKLELRIERTVTEDEQSAGDAEILRVWQNQIGLILTEIAELSDGAGDGYLIINELLVAEIGRVHDDDVPKFGDFVGARIDILWGAD